MNPETFTELYTLTLWLFELPDGAEALLYLDVEGCGFPGEEV